jgi:hypothetical protein
VSKIASPGAVLIELLVERAAQREYVRNNLQI